ncbi:MAG: magnesium transporter [Chloroflexi bacterium]|nr:magnesium transporter [Chloroflexota bacterium]
MQDQSYRDILRERLRDGQVQGALAVLAELHPADQATLLQEMSEDEASELVQRMEPKGLADLLEYLVPLGPQALAPILEMPLDSLAPVLAETPRALTANILRALPAERALPLLESRRDRGAVAALLEQKEETAGAIMTVELIALPTWMTAQGAITYIRATRPVAESVTSPFVVNEDGGLAGVLSFKDLLLADQATPLTQIMEADPVAVTVDTPQEECVRLIERYDLVSLPVVDMNGVLLGFIAFDDIIDVAEAEATEDMYRMVGLQPEVSLFAGLEVSIRRRLPWLLVNLATAFLAASVVALFESTIARAAILAAFIPLLAGQSGNQGIQTTTIVVRSIALGEVTFRNTKRILTKELLLAAFNGLLISGTAAVFAFLWTQNPYHALLLFTAMMIASVFASLAGVIIPLGLKLFRIDPALASGIFLTTVTDVVSILALLGPAALLVHLLQSS